MTIRVGPGPYDYGTKFPCCFGIKPKHKAVCSMKGRAARKPDKLAQAVKLARLIMTCAEKRHPLDHDDVATLCRLVVDLDVARLAEAAR